MKIPLWCFGILLCTCVGFSPNFANAQGVFLTGIGQSGAESTGQNDESPIWNTLGGDTFANLYVVQPNAAFTSGFINHGDGAGASIDTQLTPGTYTIYFACDGFSNNDPGYYDLNLFFDGDNTNPGISAFAPTAVLYGVPVPAGLPVLSLDGDNANQVPSPGVLTYTANGLSITLTQYSYDPAGAFGGPPLDRVSNLNDVPDGSDDGVGVIYLTVTAVPEPSRSAIIAAVLFLAIGLFSHWNSAIQKRNSLT